jgi:quercetin dioxygenase-like cupin family protein
MPPPGTKIGGFHDERGLFRANMGQILSDMAPTPRTRPEYRRPHRSSARRVPGILKEARGTASGTPGEVLDAQYGVGVSPLTDNDRVLVVKQRYDPVAYGGPSHFHGEDVLVVYLRGGYTWPLADLWGPSRVRRGDVNVIPANTQHRLGNAGGDPLELLVIVPK